MGLPEERTTASSIASIIIVIVILAGAYYTYVIVAHCLLSLLKENVLDSRNSSFYSIAFCPVSFYQEPLCEGRLLWLTFVSPLLC